MVKKFIEKLKTPEGVKWFWRIVAAPVVLLILLMLLIGIGAFGKLPSFEELENPKSNLATEIYSEDGVMIGSFFVQNRSFVEYNDLSPALVAALVSTEDVRYYTHSGIDFISLARVGIRTVALGQGGQGGGSTISQQLAKNLYPRDTVIYRNPVSRGSKMVVTKLKEWITAVMIEHNYTKEEIITMYLNTVEYGSNAWGIKSAARTFFNKAPDELNIQEAAMLVGVVNKPTRYSPRSNPKYALARRNLVLARMRSNDYLTRKACDSISALPIELDFRPISHNEGTGTYFREMLKRTMTMKRPTRGQFLNEWDFTQEAAQWDNNPLYGWCIKNTKADGTPYDIYRDGLKIYTTINSSMQTYAEEAVAQQMSTSVQPAMDAQYKRTKQLFWNLSKEEIERAVRNAMLQTDRYRHLKNEGASEEDIRKNFDTPTEMRIFTYAGERDTIMTPRDSILHHKRYLRTSFVALDPTTGYVKAYIGGPDFRYFKYDMAKQGKRQVGSTIKPFIYTFAIDQLGYTPCTLVPNLPVAIETYNGEPWEPKESSKVEYDGALNPLSWGLARSRNNYSAWIMKQAKQPQAVADYIHKLGIKSYIDPVYALCLGTPDFSLFELVGAYSTFANRGVSVDPIFVTRIEDRHGNLLATFSAPAHDAVSEQTAYTMLGMLKNVVNAGTAGRLKWAYNITGDVGGKTGTSQNNSDAWFVGVTPKLVGGAWVGGEDRSVHLLSSGEGAALALPIFGEFMKLVYADKGLGISMADQFATPVGSVIYNCTQDENPSYILQDDNDEFFN